MYNRYAESAGLKTEDLESSPSELGGLKEVIFRISGESVFRKLRYESGVHRVQRVPATEAQGRIHTSTATVAVLPEAEDVDLELKPEDLRIEVSRAGGPGGQGVNTIDTGSGRGGAVERILARVSTLPLSFRPKGPTTP